MREPATEDVGMNRTRAVLAVLPFFLLGVGNLLLILGWGLERLWGFLMLPPVLFICVLGYLAFRTGLARDRVGDVEGDPDADSP